MTKSNYKVIGVMSGTSLDGIDIIYATFIFDKYWTFEIHYAETIRYSDHWKSILSQLVKQSLSKLDEIDTKYSEFLGYTILDFIDRNHISKLDFVASHGHTALHQPENGLTFQIGNQQILSSILNKKVICDFRVQDVELGGQGAPLVPIGDRLLFHQYDYCLNLGGFANVSYEEDGNRIAFDICPVNLVLNHYVSQLDLDYDDKGYLASTGNMHSELLNKLNQIAFYQQPPPKSLGLEWVKEHIFHLIDSYDLKVEDILRTFVEHIAVQISKAINQNNTNVLITGGGVYNDFLIKRLELLSKTQIVIPSKEIIDYKEALIFGLLGVLKERSEINCLKSVTGAELDHSSGKILIPN